MVSARFKVHEDLGAHMRSLDTALRVAEEHDVQVALHTDGLNENLSVADTLAVIDGRACTPITSRAAAAGTSPTCSTLAGVAERHRLLDQPDAPLRSRRDRRARGDDRRRPRPSARAAR